MTAAAKTKRGRPPAEDPREVQMQVRLTRGEADELAAAAHADGLSASTWVRVEALKVARRGRRGGERRGWNER